MFVALFEIRTNISHKVRYIEGVAIIKSFFDHVLGHSVKIAFMITLWVCNYMTEMPFIILTHNWPHCFSTGYANVILAFNGPFIPTYMYAFTFVIFCVMTEIFFKLFVTIHRLHYSATKIHIIN